MSFAGFDPSQHEEPKNEYAELPNGDYKTVISNTTIIDEPEKGEKGINFEFTINEGDFENRKIWMRMYSQHDTYVWQVSRSKEFLTQLCNKANGGKGFQSEDASELVGNNVVVRVYKNKKGYTTVAEFKEIGAAVSTPSSQASVDIDDEIPF